MARCVPVPPPKLLLLPATFVPNLHPSPVTAIRLATPTVYHWQCCAATAQILTFGPVPLRISTRGAQPTHNPTHSPRYCCMLAACCTGHHPLGHHPLGQSRRQLLLTLMPLPREPAADCCAVSAAKANDAGMAVLRRRLAVQCHCCCLRCGRYCCAR